jgi:competence protein ComEA
MPILLLVFASSTFLSAQRAPQAKSFESIPGCVLVPDRSNDGDSFVVRFPDGREDTVRLYFVDAPESETAYRDRLDEQGAYFGITRTGAAIVGKEASEFTAKALATPFTVQTRWRSLFGRRLLVMITTSTGDDLGELLVRNGLARIHGVRTPLPDGRTSREYLAHLAELEEQAKEEGIGAWREEM